MKKIFLKNISELPSVAKVILDFAKDKKIFCFYGELGAGKTTLIKEICRQLRVEDAGSSPTFSIVNEYRTAAPALKTTEGSERSSKAQSSPLGVGGLILYHLDLYRLRSEAEIYDIGYEDYLFSGNPCFIEWPEKMEHLLPKEVIRIRIKVQDNDRVIEME